MPRHGKFDAVALLHRSARASVWSARPAGAAAAPPNHCVKLVELSDHELADRDASNAEHLLVGAALQQSMADKSQRWAPVYELGTDDGTDAFYVTKLYPRSAQSIIDGRVRLSSADLRTVMLGVVDALLDLEAAYGRPHANLKPSNVLIGDPSRAAPVVLSDPGALAENVPSLTKAPDTKAVGQLLYALVTHRPHTGARWPLAKGDAWRAMGASGKQWFALCEALVNPFGEGASSLTELRARIAAIQTSRRRLPRAVVAVPVLAAVAVAVYLGRHQVADGWQSTSKALADLTRPRKVDKSKQGPRFAPATRPSETLVRSKPPAPPKPDMAATLADLRISPAPAPLGGPVVDVLPSPVLPLQHPRGETPAVQPAPPTPSAVAQATTPVTPPVVTPPSGPISSPVNSNASVNRRALAVVRDWSSPDFRSDAAQSAFEDGRKHFLAAHENDDPGVTLAQWEGISTRLRLAGDAYPPVDVAATAGWPIAVADQVAARREQVLARAVAAAFDQASFDPGPYHKLTEAVRSAVSAASTARKALAGGSVPAARAAVADFQNAVKLIAVADTGVADAMSASASDLDRLTSVETAADRDKLIATADDEQAPLAVRADAWVRAGTVKTDKPWPADFATAAADQNRGIEIAGLLHDQVATAAEKQIATELDHRLAAYMASLRDQPAVAAAATQASDPQYAELVARCPAWFRFDAGLATARRTPAATLKPEQRQALLDLASKADVPAARDVIDLLHAGDRRAARSLAEAGPASTGAWRLHAGATHDRCTYDATTGGDASLEFARVHVATTNDPGADPAAIDCYICTSAVPVSLMSHLLADDPTAVAAARELNGTPTAGDPTPGPTVWKFDDTDPSRPVAVDGEGYRRCFIVPPNDRFPVQRVTPQLALYLARRAGCRLPSAVEWRAAVDSARSDKDPIAHGFAVYGWKLRTAASYGALLTNGARDPDVPPDGGGFMADASTAIWSPADIVKLGGRLAGDPPSPLDPWPLSTLETTDGFGFRPVAGTDDYAGVFHDLVGNVAQFVLDIPATLAEQLDAGRPTAADVKAWFTPERLAAVSVVGGSAVSPPSVDPTKPYPLPTAGPTSFTDVGFRLAFTDPAARPAEAWTALRRMPFAPAP